MANLDNLIDALCTRLEIGIPVGTQLPGQRKKRRDTRGLPERIIDGLKMAGVRRHRIESEDAKTKLEPFAVVAPAGIGSGWMHNGDHPYASAGIAVLVYPGARDRKAGRFQAAQRFSDEAHALLMSEVPFIWPNVPDAWEREGGVPPNSGFPPNPRWTIDDRETPPKIHVISIRLESGPEPVVVEGTRWPCMSRIYNVNANIQEAFCY